jgi:hypothetical protein
VSRAHIDGKGHTVGDHKHLGMAKAVATNIYLAIGMMVKLTVNICPDRELGLYNNSRCVALDIVYGGDGSHPAHDPSWQERSPVVMWVEFADYKGPPLDSGKTIRPRGSGGPYLGKADTIHGLQGLTVAGAGGYSRILSQPSFLLPPKTV